MSEPEPTPPQTLLQIVAECDNFVVPPSASVSGKAEEEALASWHLFPDASSPALGLIRPIILAQLKLETTNSWKFWTHNNVDKVSFADHIKTPKERSSIMKELCERWRDQGLWPGQIGPKKWRGEMYPIYRHPFGKLDAPLGSEGNGDDIEDDSRNYAFRMERSACALFGTVTYGVHMTVYQDDPEKATRNEQGALENESCRIWVPKRAKTKQTWPGYLDNSVAGGITCGITPFECAVKEAMEEASIPEDIVAKYAKSVGCVSYFYRYVHHVVFCRVESKLLMAANRRTNAGWLQPEVE